MSMKNVSQVFTAFVVAGLLVLTAWGNAISLLIFSTISAAVWCFVPRIRGETSLRRALSVGAISFAVAVAVGWLMAHSRIH